MSALSKQDVIASLLDLRVQKAFLSHIEVVTVAAAGSDQTDAAKLTGSFNAVTGADGAKGVILPKSKKDTRVEVVNTVSNQDLLVYPDTGAQINALTVTTGAFTQVAGSRAVYICDADGHWYVAAANLTGTATTSSTAELNYLDIAVLGTGAASKAVVLDTGEDYVWPATGILTYGVLKDPAGTTLGATAAELNTAADQSAQTETLTADGAISVTKRITKIADTGTGAYTLAAPDATLLGMVKIIEMTVDNGDITVALANVDGAAANTTATFANVGEHIVLVAGVSKWLYLNGTATLS